MTDYQQLRKVTQLIAGKLLNHLSRKEETDLSSWLDEHPENRKLYHRVKSSERFLSWVKQYNSVNTESRWDDMYQYIQQERKHLFYRNVMKYAAIFILPFLLLGSAYYFLFNSSQEPPHTEQTATIKPGSTKAVLLLDDGYSIILDSIDNQEFEEADGTVISKEEGMLKYTQRVKVKSKTPIYNTIRIPRGGEYELVLSDGSRVFLNAMSEIRFPVQFSGDFREVELKGEAYFEVNHLEEAPFIVKTSGINIEVLGTCFNVNSYPGTGQVTTTLIDGKVKIISEDHKSAHILKPEEQLVFDINTHQIEVRKVDVSLYTAWKEGEFIFYNEPLEDIMNSLTRWYSAEVEFESAALKELRFSGSLGRYEDIDLILDIIRSTERVDIEVDNNLIRFNEKQ